MIATKQLLTNSRMQTAKTCLRKELLAYELAIRPPKEAKPLRIGTAIHLGRELVRGNGWTPDDAIIEVAKQYDTDRPTEMNAEWAYDWEIERETVIRLLGGYFWRWAEHDMQLCSLGAERVFEIPIINPATGGRTNNFMLAGKIDDIEEAFPDGRQLVHELKTTNKDLDPAGRYFRKLRIDSQVSTYYLAARTMGYQPEAVLYDVIRKPTIQPRQIPETDDFGIEIVLDAEGERVKRKRSNEWRRTGDKAQGDILQTRPEKPEEYGKRITDDIAAQPDKYFCRREIPRLDADIEEHRFEIWQMQQLIRECQKHDRWPRNTDACDNYGCCPYFDLCTNGFSIDAFREDPGTLPEGFVVVDNIHQELTQGD